MRALLRRTLRQYGPPATGQRAGSDLSESDRRSRRRRQAGQLVRRSRRAGVRIRRDRDDHGPASGRQPAPADLPAARRSGDHQLDGVPEPGRARRRGSAARPARAARSWASTSASRRLPPTRTPTPTTGHRVRELAPHCDYIAVNVSSPNTPGLRDMQSADRLRALLTAVRQELAALGVVVPVLVKIAPDLGDEEIDAIADVALEQGLDGIIATNTTVDFGVLGPSRAPCRGDRRGRRLGRSAGGALAGGPQAAARPRRRPAGARLRRRRETGADALRADPRGRDAGPGLHRVRLRGARCWRGASTARSHVESRMPAWSRWRS